MVLFELYLNSHETMIIVGIQCQLSNFSAISGQTHYDAFAAG